MKAISTCKTQKMPEDDEGDADEDLEDESGDEADEADHGPPAERIAKVWNADPGFHPPGPASCWYLTSLFASWFLTSFFASNFIHSCADGLSVSKIF